MLLVHVVLTAALIAAGGDAGPQTLRVFTLSGDAPRQIRRSAEAVVQKGIDLEGIVVTLEAAPIEDATVVFDCSANEPACIRSIASALSADLLVHGRLTRASGQRFELLLTLDRSDGRVLATAEAQFDEAGLVAAVDHEVRDLIARGLGGVPRTGRLSITSQPSGASVFRAGVMSGTTPVALDLPYGRHLIELKSHERVQRRVVEIDSAAQTLQVQFASAGPDIAATTPGPPTSRSPWLMPGVTMGIGAVAAGIGAALLVSARSKQTELDEGVAQLSSPPTSVERMRLEELDALASSGRTTATLGYVAVGAGVTTVVAALIWGLTSTDDPDELSGLTVTPAGAAVRW